MKKAKICVFIKNKLQDLTASENWVTTVIVSAITLAGIFGAAIGKGITEMIDAKRRETERIEELEEFVRNNK